MKQQKAYNGFTLIELVIVIVILGVLAAIAVPKFVNLSRDARVSVIDSIEGSMRSITTFVYARAVIENTPDQGADSDRSVMTNLGLVDTWYKYPESKGEQGSGYGIAELISLEADDITVFTEDKTEPACWSVKIGYDEATCYVQYKEACSSTTPPEITLDKSGC